MFEIATVNTLKRATFSFLAEVDSTGHRERVNYVEFRMSSKPDDDGPKKIAKTIEVPSSKAIGPPGDFQDAFLKARNRLVVKNREWHKKHKIHDNYSSSDIDTSSSDSDDSDSTEASDDEQGLDGAGAPVIVGPATAVLVADDSD